MRIRKHTSHLLLIGSLLTSCGTSPTAQETYARRTQVSLQAKMIRDLGDDKTRKEIFSVSERRKNRGNEFVNEEQWIPAKESDEHIPYGTYDLIICFLFAFFFDP